MFTLYREIPWGEKTKYKRLLATELELPMTTITNWFTYNTIPKHYHEDVKNFNEKYTKKRKGKSASTAGDDR